MKTKNTVLKLAFCLVLFCFSNMTRAISPQPNFVRGQLICHLQQTHNTNFLKNVSAVKNVEILGSNLVRIYFDYSNIDEDGMIVLLKKSFPEQILSIQKNHKTYLRNTPNDSGYTNQGFWNLIKADVAWNKTTGGINRRGDTIVLAMIDDGLDTLHEDIQNNIWRNYNEIPYDGIDNDSNGYIDDYNGWNAYTNTPNIVDNVEKARHGTSVAGLMGADGNNNVGVTGGNWHVKILTVLGGSTDEVENIKAFQYVLDQKKLYLETNGKRGAYIVALNCSWGADGVYAKDAPIWCAFYDTLGLYGITTVGATSNQNIDVEQVGDLPTLCTSNHLLMVTNVNAFSDLKVNAGFSATHVDMGSIGDGTYSLCASNSCGKPYRGFSGTSGASPVTAGLFGLIYSYACDSFAALSKSNPAQASLLAKQWIMLGVEQNSSLQGITVTGGRVNYANTLDEANKWCTSINQAINVNKSPKEISNNFKLYPNPSNGKIQIEGNLNINKISITDACGKIVFTENYNINNVQLNLGLQSGIYLITIKTLETSETIKFLIE